MSFVQQLENHLNQAKHGRYEIKDLNFLPSVQNMSQRKAYRVKVCAVYIELRGANNLEISQWERSIEAIHQLMIDPIHQILAEYEGQVISTPGNGILALWTANKSNINQAVQAAMTINWMLKEKYQIQESYPNFDFGIGIHHGLALAIKTRIPGTDFEDEVKYISPVINISQTMSNQLSLPNSIGISHDVYQLLYDESVTIKKSFVLIPYQKNIWQDNKIRFNEKTVQVKTTAHHLDYTKRSINKH